MRRTKGMILIGSKGIHKGKRAIYLGNSQIRIIDAYSDPIVGNMKGYVCEDKKIIFKPKKIKR